MRTLIDIPDEIVDKLDTLGHAEQRSRASMIREAIAEYLVQRQPAPDAGFGLWGQRKLDGLAYQKKIRAEW
jgi:predicted transcriptional regulator